MLHFRDILEKKISRRNLINKTASGALLRSALASSLTACGDDDNSYESMKQHHQPEPTYNESESLTFTPVDKKP